MTTLADELLAGSEPEPEPDLDSPRLLGNTKSRADLAFIGGTGGIGTVVLALAILIGVFLGIQFFHTIHRYGTGFFTQNRFDPELNIIGIESALIGTVEVAVIALLLSFPLAMSLALYVSEYAPARFRAIAVSAIDLMAAIPSIIYGLWGYFLIMPHALYISRFLAQYFGWIPLFKVSTDPNAPVLSPSHFDQSPFIAAMIVSMMVIPLGAAVMIGVFRQAPLGEREAAYALGSTRWGMIRAVVLPFGRGGIIGGTMLALGRALGETIAVLLILSYNDGVSAKVLQQGGVTISYLIANDFQDVTNVQLSALLAAGFVLYVITLAVNTVAAVIVGRGRSGAGVEI